MKSRLAVILILALGVTMSGTGAALAVSGMSEGGSAGQAQYQPEERCKEGQTVGPHGEPCKPYTCAEGAHIGPHGETCAPRTCAEGAEVGPNGESCVHSEEESSTHGTEPTEESSGTAPVEEVSSEEPVQEVQQVSAGGGGSLPFTGFLAIPVLLIGIALLGVGVAMQMRMRRWDGS